jgi:hypothetical protein
MGRSASACPSRSRATTRQTRQDSLAEFRGVPRVAGGSGACVEPARLLSHPLWGERCCAKARWVRTEACATRRSGTGAGASCRRSGDRHRPDRKLSQRHSESLEPFASVGCNPHRQRRGYHRSTGDRRCGQAAVGARRRTGRATCNGLDLRMSPLPQSGSIVALLVTRIWGESHAVGLDRSRVQRRAVQLVCLEDEVTVHQPVVRRLCESSRACRPSAMKLLEGAPSYSSGIGD